MVSFAVLTFRVQSFMFSSENGLLRNGVNERRESKAKAKAKRENRTAVISSRWRNRFPEIYENEELILVVKKNIRPKKHQEKPSEKNITHVMVFSDGFWEKKTSEETITQTENHQKKTSEKTIRKKHQLRDGFSRYFGISQSQKKHHVGTSKTQKKTSHNRIHGNLPIAEFRDTVSPPCESADAQISMLSVRSGWNWSGSSFLVLRKW